MKEENECHVCYGYGWHFLGELTPIGRMDAGECKEFTIKCPWCNNGSKDTGERWKFLKSKFDEENNRRLKNNGK